MACRELQAATGLALLCGLCSLAGLLTATLLPRWRLQRLTSPNRHEQNLTVSAGLWIRCVRPQGEGRCAYRDAEWYRSLDQLDLRLLQLALPLALASASAAALLGALGACRAACSGRAPRAGLARCLVNSAGCQLGAGLLFLLSAGLALGPTAWLLLHTGRLNRRYGPAWSAGPAAYLALGSGAGLAVAGTLLLLWYCACRPLPAPLWQPLPAGVPPHHYPLPAYLSAPSSRRSRLSTLEIDIPVVRQQTC
ncbi:claudin-12 [Pristis pectinata]|uniref:claudin-12 n=1 Tax=Pristis pectinata TaxID=685728 RepID=UPI00223CF10B|nr:claudin-12 [Pristis pectinata]